MANPIQNIPPLSSISDPNTRAVLQAIVDGWRVRNGQTGDGGEKFLTANDLVAGSGGSLLGGAMGATPSGPGKVAAESVASVIQKISDTIMQSRIWKHLEERIVLVDRIAKPEWFSSRFGALITQERSNWQNATEAVARQVTTVSAELGGNIAGIEEDLLATTTTANATASQLTTVATAFNNNLALVQTQLTATSSATSTNANRINTVETEVNGKLALANSRISSVSDAGGVTAGAVTQLQNTIPGISSAAQQALSLATSVDGTVKGTWAVRFDLNGYVAGVGLGVDQKAGSPPKSTFAVRADTFAVGSPGVQDVVPFFVQDGKTYIKTAMIADASIDSAKIKDASITNAEIANAAVSTLKIAGNAVTVPLFISGSSGHLHPAGTAPHGEMTVSGYFPDICKIVMLAAVQANNPGDETNVAIRVVMDGYAVLLSQDNSTGGGWVTQHTAFGGATISAGWHSFELQLGNSWNNGSGWFAQNMSLLILGATR